jgi:hypothetical protein
VSRIDNSADTFRCILAALIPLVQKARQKAGNPSSISTAVSLWLVHRSPFEQFRAFAGRRSKQPALEGWLVAVASGHRFNVVKKVAAPGPKGDHECRLLHHCYY